MRRRRSSVPAPRMTVTGCSSGYAFMSVNFRSEASGRAYTCATSNGSPTSTLGWCMWASSIASTTWPPSMGSTPTAAKAGSTKLALPITAVDKPRARASSSSRRVVISPTSGCPGTA